MFKVLFVYATKFTKIVCSLWIFQSCIKSIQRFERVETLRVKLLCFLVLFLGLCIILKFLEAETSEQMNCWNFAANC
jgi:hypothetical protein